jgi:phospholipid transport system substrate-binding protein
MDRLRGLLAALVAVVLVMPMSHAWAGPPTDQLRQYTDHVIKILEDPAYKTGDKRFEQRAAVRKVAIEIFDVGETARRALGRHWQLLKPDERQEFVDLFADLLERTYISKIDLYGGERVKYVSESVDGDNAIVKSRVITRRATEIPVEARMLRHGDRWQIYDVLVENVSLVGNYRAQFDQIVRTSSMQELLRRLRDKRGEFASDKEPPKRTTQ